MQSACVRKRYMLCLVSSTALYIYSHWHLPCSRKADGISDGVETRNKASKKPRNAVYSYFSPAGNPSVVPASLILESITLDRFRMYMGSYQSIELTSE